VLFYVFMTSAFVSANVWRIISTLI